MAKSLARIDNLTGVRGFAALWVVLFHLGPHLGPLVGAGYLGVDVFFVLSGFVLSIVYAPRLPELFNWTWYKNFLLRRFAKIYPLHLQTFVIMVAAVCFARSFHYHFVASAENTFWTALCNLFLLHATGMTDHLSWNTPSWSVSAEWFAYLVLFAPVAFLLKRVRIQYIACISIFLWMSFLGLCNLVLHSDIGLSWNGVLRIIPEFFCGYLLYRIVQNRNVRYGDILSMSGMVVICGVLLGGDRFIALFMPGVMLLLAGLYAGGPITNRIYGNRVSVILGEASYSIYMIQIFLDILVHLIEKRPSIFGLEHGAQGYIVTNSIALTSTACIALCGVGVFRLFEDPVRLKLLRVFSAAQ